MNWRIDQIYRGNANSIIKLPHEYADKSGDNEKTDHWLKKLL